VSNNTIVFCKVLVKVIGVQTSRTAGRVLGLENRGDLTRRMGGGGGLSVYNADSIVDEVV
jgi:hypothetical protein